MIRRLHVNNYRCLLNFSLDLPDLSSVLLIGDNGVGKSTIVSALELLQKIARGTNRVNDLLGPKDLNREHVHSPARIELEVEIRGSEYKYSISFEFPPEFTELRVRDESFSVDGKPIFTRTLSDVSITTNSDVVTFRLDWHLAALPIIQARSERDPLFIMTNWLALMVILRPIPTRILGNSDNSGTLLINSECENFGSWFAGLLARYPSAYSVIDKYLKDLMPDFKDIKNQVFGHDFRRLIVQFAANDRSVSVLFNDLSSGDRKSVV